MTATAFALVFVSVFLHAGWNFLSKKTVPSLAFYALACGTAAVLCLPFAWAAPVAWGALPWSFWALFAGSVACETLYFVGLAAAYRGGDISLVYPMARALPVLMTAATTLVFGLGVPPGPVALVGMAVLSLGCLLMPFAAWGNIHPARYWRPVLGYILLAAVGTTGYTVIDSRAVVLLRADGGDGAWGAMAYLFLVEAGIALVLAVATLALPRERAEFRRLRGKSATPHISGVFSAAAYGLILLAMPYVTNVSYVQAFRQMSLPLGVLAGVLLLGEKPGPPRWVGVGLVIAGLLLTAAG